MAKDGQPFIGIDLGGTNIQVGVLDAKDKIVGGARNKTKAEGGSDEVIKRIARTVSEALEDAKIKLGDVGGVGIGAPGVVDIHKGVVLNAVNLRWNKYPLAKALSSELGGIDVTLDNDVNVGAWAEHKAGAAQDYDDLLAVFVGTGVGGGLVLGGKLYHGHFLTSGEIGHTILHADGQRGRRTLENLASRTAITDLLVQLIQTNHASKLPEISGGDLANIRSKALAEAMEKDDALTLEVVRKAAHYVGVAIANTVTLLSLPCAVLGGGVTEALDKRWVQWVRESFEGAVFPPELRDCRLVPAKLGDNAGLVGAALLARERLS